MLTKSIIDMNMESMAYPKYPVVTGKTKIPAHHKIKFLGNDTDILDPD